MFERSWCAVLLIAIAAGPSPLLAQRCPQSQQQCRTCQPLIPANIEARILASDVMALLERSDTFRAQCARIAAAPNVRVTLTVVATIDSARAQTAIRRYATGSLNADVELVFGENYRELLAHEFEHIIEQIDGVNLRQEAAAGRAWQLPGGAFETRRALTAGVQALREADTAHALPAMATAMR
jgi:hypothetical protein